MDDKMKIMKNLETLIEIIVMYFAIFFALPLGIIYFGADIIKPMFGTDVAILTVLGLYIYFFLGLMFDRN